MLKLRNLQLVSLLVVVSMLLIGVTSALADEPIIHVGGGGGTSGGAQVATTVGSTASGQASSAGGGRDTTVHFGGGGGSTTGGDGASVLVKDPCRYTAVPLTNKAAWAGYDPKKGSLFAVSCIEALKLGTDEPVYGPSGYTFAPTGAVPAAPPNAAVLAQELRNSLSLPPPPLQVSPDLPNNVDASIHLPVTYVNLWFWFWADQQTWAPLTQSTTLNGVTVNVTARPVSLSYEPGNGDAAVTCAGAGRPWSEADANSDPALLGGCGYLYTRVTASPSQPITGTLSISWQVSWTSNAAAGGQLAPLVTTTRTPPFGVEQIQVVAR